MLASRGRTLSLPFVVLALALLAALLPASASAAYRDTVAATPGLVSHWRLGELSGGPAADQQGVNSGIYVGSPSLGANGLLVQDGDKGVSFDGVDDAIKVVNSLSLAPATSLTWEGWIKPSTVACSRYLFTKVQYAASFGCNGDLRFILRPNGVFTDLYSPANSFAAGQTYYVALTWDGATMRIYKNGVQIASKAATGTLSSSYNLVIGADSSGYDPRAPYYQGVIDDVALYSRALSVSEVHDHYAAGMADTTAPETTIDSGPSGTVDSSGATLAFSSSETGSTFECRLDGSTWSSCSSPKSYSGLAAGSHTFEVRATDNLFNTDQTPASRTWTFSQDTVPPETTIDSGPTGTVESSGATFEFSASEAGSTFECRLDGGAWSSCSSPKSYSGLSAGSHTFEARATDQMSNTDPTPASRSWSFEPDTTAPETTIDAGPADTTGIPRATFEFSASEAGSTFECRLDGSAWSSCSSSKSYTGLSTGSHTFEARATDQVSNTDPTPASRTWTVEISPYAAEVRSTSGLVSYWRFDETAGTTAFDETGANNGAYLGSPEQGGDGLLAADPDQALGLDGTDDHVKVPDSPTLDTTSGFTWETWIKPSAPMCGKYLFIRSPTVRASFGCNNDVRFIVNPDGVSTDLYTPPQSFTADETYHVALTWDGETMRIYKNGAEVASKPAVGTLANTSFNLIIGAESGGYDARGDYFAGTMDDAALYSRALAASEVKRHYDLGLDPTPPQTTIESSPPESTEETDATFEFSASEANASFECRIDDGTWTTCTPPRAYSGLAYGQHTFEVRATDAAGNTDPTPATRTWSIAEPNPDDYWKGTQLRKQTIYRLIYSESPQDTPQTYDPVAEGEQILRDAERTAPSSNPAAKSLWREIRSVTIKSSLSTPLRALGTLGLAVDSFDLGWKIGTGINAKFLRIGLPANGSIPASYTEPQIRFKTAGERSPLWFKVPMPEDGWVWSIYSEAYGWQRSSEYRPKVTGGGCQEQAFTPPDGFTEVTAPSEEYLCAPYGYTPVRDLKIAYIPENGLEAAGPIEDYSNQPYDYSSDAPAAPSQSTVEGKIDNELEKPENSLLRDWLNYQLGLPGAEDPLGISGPNASAETMQRTATVLDAEYTQERRLTTDETLRKCRIPLWHYTDPGAAAAIYAERIMRESPPDPPYPAGAFATTITPLNPDWTQPTLSDHLGIESSSAWVLLCIDDGPNKRFRPDTSHPDYWYAPAEAGRDDVDVEPAAWGLNPMPGAAP